RLAAAFSRRRSIEPASNARDVQVHTQTQKAKIKIDQYEEPNSVRSITLHQGMEPAVIPARVSARTRTNMMADARRLNSQRQQQQRRSHPTQQTRPPRNANYRNNNQNRPAGGERRISNGRAWMPFVKDDGYDEENEDLAPIIRMPYEMTNPTGTLTREGTIYVESAPSVTRNDYNLTYRYIKPDLTVGEGIFTMSLKGNLPPGLRMRVHIEGQSMLAESVTHNSPDYRYKDIFVSKIATPSNPGQINGWNGWWTANQFFEDLYATDPQKFPKLYIPDSTIYPREIRGDLWQNTVLLNCNISCLDHVFEMLELAVNQNLFICIWYYRSTEDTKRLQTWSNMGDVEAPAFPCDNDVVIHCLQCENNYVLMLIWWFASPIMAKAEPARHFPKNREFGSLMIHCRVNEHNETEWMPFAGSKTIAEVCYHMLAYAFKMYEEIPEMISIQEQPKIRIIGILSLSTLMGENTAVMNRKVIDPIQDENYENYYENYNAHSIAYDAHFQPVKRASGKHCRTWELVTNPREQWDRPETMLMTILRVYNEARITWHQGGLGYEHASTQEVLAHKNRLFEKEVKKHVDIHSSPEYQEQVEKNVNLAKANRISQIKILESEDAHKALKLTELSATVETIKSERNQLAEKVTVLEKAAKLEHDSIESLPTMTSLLETSSIKSEPSSPQQSDEGQPDTENESSDGSQSTSESSSLEMITIRGPK
ncbi:unnamed protein product, partial [Oikopleura dioica]